MNSVAASPTGATDVDRPERGEREPLRQHDESMTIAWSPT
jgi:hypothetical protein